MKAAVIYYSYDGNCGLIAEKIKETLNADLLELKSEDNKKRKGLVKYIWGGRQVLSRATPSLKPYTINIEQYDLVIIGGPVWAGSPVPALNTFLGQTRIRGKKIALFCCHAGSKGKIFEKIKGMLPENTFLGEIDFVTPLKGDRRETEKKLSGWLDTIAAFFPEAR
jgi:flavodoxin